MIYENFKFVLALFAVDFTFNFTFHAYFMSAVAATRCQYHETHLEADSLEGDLPLLRGGSPTL